MSTAFARDTLQAWELEQQDWKHLAESTRVSEENWKYWQELLLNKVLEEQEKEKSRTGLEAADIPEDEMRRKLRMLIKNIEGIPAAHYDALIAQFLDDSYRMGPIQPLWDRERVSDIQVFVPIDDKYPQVITYFEGERKVYTGQGFRNYDHARDWVNHHLSRIGLRYDPSKIQLDGMFPGGERIHIISGPCGYSLYDKKTKKYTFVRCMILSIRRFVASFTLDELTDKSPVSDEPPVIATSIQQSKTTTWKRKTKYALHTGGMADRASMDFLRIMVRMKKNHILVGGTGIGKTTLANALTQEVPVNEVLLVLEEAPEMQPQCEGTVIRIYMREGVFSLADGMKGALRMFPDRIFVAELRDSLAYVFIQAIQSGHDGSSTTAHASTCLAGIERVIEMAKGHPSKPDGDLIRKTLYERIDTVLHGRREGKKRFFDEIIQLLPDGTHHKVMEYVQEGTDKDGSPIGYFVFYGPTDEFVREMQKKGIPIPESWGWEETTC
ncbi:pilus assembly protein CpaF [Brevibacillus aydinogluensis]|jgi:pilus assembly protein CpaF|uniref:ATPase, T2SS/T4P/T4SS family n=1 Tax=Brevibacillus aydinogluensis TaxID=927786 RepID=UPI0028935DF6|nr:ATPase, T2SS/T4P/T4SS family [Brevibacillus aydinogluensis]MDT3418133.1 pilus assembly protein CpaF [Brevibacillus aydinogluensis]